MQVDHDDSYIRHVIEHYSDPVNQAAYEDRCGRIQKMVLTVLNGNASPMKPLNIAEIGCSTGTMSQLWAKQGHRVFGIDISEKFIEIARQRAAAANLSIGFEVGSATKLPWNDESMNIVIAPELLEHIPDWEGSLREFIRILKPGGVLYLTTTNVLFPWWQEEFGLPFYPLYPAPIKRHCERLAVTSHRHWVSYTKFPPVNWFTHRQLSKYLKQRGLTALDRFDILERMPEKHTRGVLLALKVIQSTRLTKRLAQFAEQQTWVIATKL
jgi:2-polyprenyl-6-hydroxyphenyl methylase/3-demethylubiquinone-9 3-methyltransferase